MRTRNRDVRCLYGRWTGMHKRCKYKNGNYGKLHISVCAEWSGEGGFENFVNWALKNGFSEDFVLDRKNTFGPYSPENCRWILQKENNRNKANTVYISDVGKAVPLSSYCENHGLSQAEYARLYGRIRRSKK